MDYSPNLPIFQNEVQPLGNPIQYPKNYASYTDLQLIFILRRYIQRELNNEHVIKSLNFQEYPVGALAHQYDIRLNDVKENTPLLFFHH